MKKFKSHQGFTLIEVLMTVTLVGIMSAVIIPQFIDYSQTAKTTVTQEKLISMKQAIIGDPRVVVEGRVIALGFLNHIGSLPSSLTDLVSQGAKVTYDPFTKKGWRGPYLNNTDTNWNRDAWGTLIEYSAASRYVRSCGPDKTCGNADDISVSF